MTLAAESAVYYDPYDTVIDLDPYPVWKRLRDEAPLYYNEKYDFYAVSRYDDVDTVLSEWEIFSSARGTLLELIKADFEMPPGSIIFEDPPAHDLHRELLKRAFRPRDIAALEPKIREYCAEYLDQHVGTDGFDLIQQFGKQVPMRTIFLLLGVPEEDQERLRESIDGSLEMQMDADGNPVLKDHNETNATQSALYADYLDWRADHPSDDIMTELLSAEFEDEHGVTRTMTRPEMLSYINLLAAAGNETTTKLIGWAGKLLATNPDQRADLIANPNLMNNAIEEILRVEAPSPVQARHVKSDYEFHGQTVPAGSAILALNASANRDERQFENPDKFDIRRKRGRHNSFGYGIHFCMGAALARLEGKVAVEELLKRFPDFDVDLANAHHVHTSTVRGFERLPIVLK